MAITFGQLGLIDEMRSKTTLDWCDITVKECLERLARQYGFSLEKIIFEGDILSKELVILINGLSIDKQSGLHTIIKDRDSVLMMGIVSGG
ncbi:MAG: MoaD/ThiS family protein [Clostridiales bacterium]|nr:MoaD/ThiS family protein [Clostridiales bacterium]